MNKPIRNAIIVNDSACVDGGAAKVALGTAALLSKKGMNVGFFAGGRSYDESCLGDAAVKLVDKTSLRAGGRSIRSALDGIWDFGVESDLTRFLASYDVSETVVHVHSWASVLSPSVFSAILKSGFPLVITAHDYCLACPNSCRFDFSARRICSRVPGSARCYWRNCDRDSMAIKLFRDVRYLTQTRILKKAQPSIVFVSDFQREKLDPYLRFDHACATIPNPIGSEGRSSDASSDCVGYLYVGRIEVEKGVDVFCEAVRRTGTKGVVLGEGKERERLSREYPEVEFRGWADKAEVSAAMRSARALVFPSRWYEAAPLTPVEAQMESSLPCIVSDSCAAVDCVIDEKTGYVFEAGNAQSLASCLAKMEDGKVAGAIRRNIEKGIDDVFVRHSSDRYHSLLMETYETASKAMGIGR